MPLNTQRTSRVIGAVLAVCALMGAGAADARIVEMGQLEEDVVPSCPSDPCRALSRTSTFQKRIDGVEDAFTVPANGRIVAWTIALAAPTNKQIKFFEENFSGEPSAGITVFRASKKKGERGIYTSIGESGVQTLTNYYGQTVQFPMANTLRVLKGDRVGLTVPTWAPALAVNQAKNTTWRATRDEDSCTDFFDQTAIQELGTQTMFGCGYRTERLTYSVTLITAPKPNKTDDKKKDKPKR
jgi:hypothetical protein